MIETDVPARLDRLPWSRFHWLVVTGLGIAWILDGLEVTLVGSLSGAIEASPVLRMSAARVGLSASAYLVGAVAGALVFGWLADRWGRKRLFAVTVAVYLVATLATGLAWNFWSFALFRAVTGAGIGGEYAAVNAAIQELIPARRRGFTDLVINGSFWIGAALGAGGSLVVLDPRLIPPELGWRLAFAIGGVLGLGVLALRRWIPESPRWLMTHGRPGEAERVVAGIEARVAAETGPLPPVPPGVLRLRTDVRSWFGAGMVALVTRYRRRTVLGVVLMATQAFCYNAVFFTYALILTRFYGVAAGKVGLFILPFAVGNFFGPLLLGPLFDSLGRRTMITATYAALRCADGDHRLVVRLRRAVGGGADGGVDGDLLRRLGRGELGLSDGGGEFSPGGARGRDRAVLRVRNLGGRGGRPGAVRRADPGRLAGGADVGLRAGGGADAAGRGRGLDAGRGGGAAVAGGGGTAAGDVPIMIPGS